MARIEARQQRLQPITFLECKFRWIKRYQRIKVDNLAICRLQAHKVFRQCARRQYQQAVKRRTRQRRCCVLAKSNRMPVTEPSVLLVR